MAASLVARFRAGRRRLRFTREGRWFVGVTFAIGFGAINTQNNLLYLLLSLLVSLILLSGILSELVLRRLEITRTPPPSIFAGRRTPIEIRVRNPKWYPSYAVEVEDLIEGHATLRRCFYLKVSPGREQATTYPFVFPRRGACRFRGFEVRTKFPFGLFAKSRIVEDPLDRIVYPEPVASPEPSEPREGPELPSPRERRGMGTDLLDPRRFVPGDDPRLIRWRLSARTGQILVADRAADETQRVEIAIDNRVRSDPRDPEVVRHDERRVEREISRAAHRVLEASHYASVSIRIVAADAAIGPLPATHARSLLRFLALLPYAPLDAPPPARARDDRRTGPVPDRQEAAP
jgi:uncharacterized protein (DUF58 family)